MAFLRYLDDTGLLQIRTLDSEKFVIGRADTCDVTFDTDTMSREHVRIEVEPDGRFRIRDLGSRNRSYVNGQQITETLLTSGDIIRAGDRVLEFVDPSTYRDGITMDFLTEDRKDPLRTDWVKLKTPLSLTISQIEQLSRLFNDQAMMARPEDTADTALGQIVLDVQAERGLVALRGEDKTELRPLAHRALAPVPTNTLTPVNRSFLFAPVLQSSGGRYPEASIRAADNSGFATTAMVAPLTYRGDVVGVLYVDRPTSKRPFRSSSLQYLMAAGAQLGAMIGETSRKLTRAAAREGIAWMTTIRRIQNLLTTAPASNDTFDTAVKLYPGRVRCGDFADVVHLDEFRSYGLVIDAGGHGMSGLIQAHAIRTAVRTAVGVTDDTLMDPGAIFNEINELIAGSGARQVLPCTYVGIDMASGKLAYINAGGTPPLLMIAPSRLVTLDHPSLVLGIDRDYLYETTRVDLPEVFRVVCRTDGLAEASSAGGEPIGDRRIHDALLATEAFGSAADVLEAIGSVWTTQMAGSNPDDDASVLVIAHG